MSRRKDEVTAGQVEAFRAAYAAGASVLAAGRRAGFGQSVARRIVREHKVATRPVGKRPLKPVSPCQGCGTTGGSLSKTGRPERVKGLCMACDKRARRQAERRAKNEGVDPPPRPKPAPRPLPKPALPCVDCGTTGGSGFGAGGKSQRTNGRCSPCAARFRARRAAARAAPPRSGGPLAWLIEAWHRRDLDHVLGPDPDDDD